MQEKRPLSFLEADAHAVYLVGSDLASEDERPPAGRHRTGRNMA